MYRVTIALLMLLALGACSNQQVYNNVQVNQKNECEKLQLTQRQDCLNKLSPDYNEYEAERKKLIENKK